jgi:euchromatic histone-lysine N-methyltransferase
MFERDVSDDKMEGKREEVGGATETHNCKVQESQVVGRVLDDVAGGKHGRDHPRNNLTDDSPAHGLSEEIDERTQSHERARVPLVAGDGDVRSECEGSLPKGTSRTHPRGLVYVRTNGKRKLNHDNIDKDNLKSSPGKESKRGHHVAIDQVKEKGDAGLTTKRVTILALMAPDLCPWAQRKKSIVSVSKSLTSRNNVKKNGPTRKQELSSKVAPSSSTRHKTKEGQEGFFPEDDETSLALDVHEKGNELCVTPPPCAASEDGSVGAESKVTKIGERSRLHEGEHGPLVTVDVKYEGSLQEGNPRTHARGLVNAKTTSKTQGLVSVKVNVTHIDEIGIFEDDAKRNKISNTQRRVTRSNMRVKQCMITRKLKNDGINKDPSERSTKESKCGNHLLTDQTKENDDKGLVTNTTVLALMAPDNCPWTQGKKSIAGASQPLNRKIKYLTVREGLCLPDMSEGKESIPICVFNTIDDMQPMPFEYITKVIYPPSYEKAPPKGCDCTNGCSDSSECACAVKNEGEIPFNLNSEIIYTKPVIYECGPSCR